MHVMMRDSRVSRVVLSRCNGRTTACGRGVRRGKRRKEGCRRAGLGTVVGRGLPNGHSPIASGASRASIVHSGNRSASGREVESGSVSASVMDARDRCAVGWARAVQELVFANAVGSTCRAFLYLRFCRCCRAEMTYGLSESTCAIIGPSLCSA
jgi:hypothetical protein